MTNTKSATKLKKKQTNNKNKHADTPQFVTSKRRKSPPELTLQVYAGMGGIG